METFEDKIKQKNEEAKAAARAAEKEAKAAARAEKIDNALSSVKKAVLSPFEKIKAGIEKAKAEQKFQEQCQEFIVLSKKLIRDLEEKQNQDIGITVLLKEWLLFQADVLK